MNTDPAVVRTAQQADSGSPVALIIGSGFGGLAAAVRLAARGYRVTVLEQLDAPGGRAYVHRRDGHVFDAGPTIVTVPSLFEELWTLAGRRMADDIELRPLERVSVQLRGTRAVTTPDIDADDAAYKPGLRYQAVQAIAATRGQPANLATIGDSWHSMKLVADIFGLR